MVRFSKYWASVAALLSVVVAQDVTQQKIAQLNAASKNTEGQIETTNNGVEANTTDSLRAGPRGYNLLEDTTVRKKILHFDRERQPERVVHALGSGGLRQLPILWRLVQHHHSGLVARRRRE